jgi:uncharacterized protein
VSTVDCELLTLSYNIPVATSFLTGVPTDAAMVNERSGRLLASAVEIAATSETRRKGLLGRDTLDPSTAMIIAPCSAVHTFFMRFTIDVVFVDRAGLVRKIARDLKPWRMAASLGSWAVVELNAGGAARGDVRVGDRLVLRA